MLTREQLQQQLETMRLQAAHYEEQLTMTRGAVQMIEHLLLLADDNTNGAGEVEPAPTEKDD